MQLARSPAAGSRRGLRQSLRAKKHQPRGVPPMPSPGRSSVGSLTVGPHQTLAGTYPDDVVEDLAAEEGQAHLFTGTWGKGNREPRTIHAINYGAETSTNLISHDLQDRLPEVERQLEEQSAQAAGAEEQVISDIDRVEATGDELARVREVCHEGELEVPEHHWRRSGGEWIAFGSLGTGDLYFTSTTFQEFGLSSRPTFGPWSELDIVAMSVVAAMLLLTRLGGHLVRKAGYLTEQVSGGKVTEGVDERRIRVLTVRTWFTVVAAGLGLIGALGILWGLSAVRASYLRQSGIDAHQGPFLLIQLGIAVCGFVLAYWLAHPLDAEWHSATFHDNRAVVALTNSYIVLAAIVGNFNALLRERDALLARHRDWGLATISDAARKGQMWARRVQLAQPEPTDEHLLPNDMPAPVVPPLVEEVNRYLVGEPAKFKPYKPLSLDRVERRLHELDDRRQKREADRHLHLGAVIAKAREQVLSTASSGNGVNGTTP